MDTAMTLPLCNQSNMSDVTSEDCTSTPVAGATIISPVIMFIIGVVGNVVAICTIQISSNTARTSKFYILISGLAWTDLLGIVLTTPSVISAYINGRKWVGGEAHCFYQGFAMTCAGLSTTLIICAISVERFLALKCVFFYSSRCSHGTTRCVIGGLWVCVIWFGLLPLFGFGRYEVQYPGTWCFLDFHSDDIIVNTYAYIYASLNLILVLIMIMCNGYVVYTLYTLRKRKEFQVEDGKRDSLLTSQPTEWTTGGFRTLRKHHSTVDTQMIVLMCAITTTFVICWAPLMILIIVTIATKKPNYLWDLAAIRLASLNQLMDPWLYILLRKSIFLKIKGSLTKIGRKICCCATKDVTELEEMVKILAIEMKHDSLNNVNAIDNGDELREVNPVNCDIDENIPDVSNVIPTSSKRVSPLPDVTNTGQGFTNAASMCIDMTNGELDSNTVRDDIASTNNIVTNGNRQQQYVCRLEIGNKDQASSDVGSVYIKVLFLNDKRHGKRHETKGNAHACPRLQVTRTVSDNSSTGSSKVRDNRVATLELSPCQLSQRQLSPCQLSPCQLSPCQLSPCQLSQHQLRPDISFNVSSSEVNTTSAESDRISSLRRTQSNT